MKKVSSLIAIVCMASMIHAQVSITPNNQAKPADKPQAKPAPTAAPAPPAKPTDGYNTVMGGLKMTTNHIAFMNINNTQTKTDTAKLMNNWSQTMTFVAKNVPAHIKLDIPASLEPGKTGLMIVTYDASKKNDFGFIQDRFNISTNDTATPEKNVIITAQISEYFPPMTKADSASAPKIVFKEKSYDYGKIKQGDVAHKDYSFKNEGKKELIIRKTKASCGCTASQPEKTSLKPGEESNIKVDFNSTGKTGKQSKTITVITNDPINPTTILTISGEVTVPEVKPGDVKPGDTKMAPAPAPVKH